MMEGALLRRKLIDLGQEHLFPTEANEQDQNRLLKQLVQLDAAYPGGLESYIKRSRILLADAKNGKNPYTGCVAEVPKGSKLTPGFPAYSQAEEIGIENIIDCIFVFVAGGLGERLGYPGIKLNLPSESSSGMVYAEYYCKCIRAYEKLHREKSGIEKYIPVVIMTSEDTHYATVELFEKHQNFGLKRDQIVLLQQQKVPAISDDKGRLATRFSDPFTIETKPHGHGDVHTILHSSGFVKTWVAQGKKWILFNQDTNALVFKCIPAALGHSILHSYTMNTIAVPRKPGEAVGAICCVKTPDGEMTINVEYNLLDPLLKSQGMIDEPGADGFSKFPGNTNSLIFNLKRYKEVLEDTGGSVPEFVNPKYKDVSKTLFKSPTRLECMMQEFPRLLKPEDKVGFVEIDRWACYSPVKNNIVDAAAKLKANLAPECGLSGESDIYAANVRFMQIAISQSNGKIIIPEDEIVTYQNISYPMGPRVVLYPSWAMTFETMKHRLKDAYIHLHHRSTLIIDGNVNIKHLEVDGTLILRADPGASLTIEKLVVKNKGWSMEDLMETEKTNHPEYALRGFKIVKYDQEIIHIKFGDQVVCK